MDEQEATKFVMRELADYHPRDDIIEKLCKATGMNWEQAEEFVRKIESQDQNIIQKSRSRTFVFLVIGAIVLGLATIILIFIAQKQTLLAIVLNAGTTIAGFVICIWDLYETSHGGALPYSSRSNSPIRFSGKSYFVNLYYFLLGLGMVVGGFLGIWKVIIFSLKR